MDVNAVTTLVSSIGFPIVACFACGYYVKYQGDNHREQISELTKAIENNTMVITKLLERLDDDGH